MTSKEDGNVSKLPEWKHCLDQMKKQGIEYGKSFSVDFFEINLKMNRDDLRYSLAISKIRRELEKDGYYLSGRGQKGNQYVIIQPRQNVDVMNQYTYKAIDALNRGVILGTNTPLYLLEDGDRRRHEQMLQSMATRLALMSRTDKMVGQESRRRLLKK